MLSSPDAFHSSTSVSSVPGAFSFGSALEQAVLLLVLVLVLHHIRWVLSMCGSGVRGRAIRLRRQNGFPTFVMDQRHYARTSATRYRCGDNRTKVKTFVTSAWYHWWHVGPHAAAQLPFSLRETVAARLN